MPFIFFETDVVTWWHWAAFGLIVLGIDILWVNTYFLMWFGIAAFPVALMLLLFPDVTFWAQLFVYGASAVILLFAWNKFWRPEQQTIDESTLLQTVIGQYGVIVNFDPKLSIGTVRLQRPIADRTIWNVASQTPLKTGQQVVVTAVNPDKSVTVEFMKT